MVLAVVEHGPASIEKPPELVRGAATRLPWAWDGLCFAVPFHEASQHGLRDIVNNVAPTVQSNVAWGLDNRGNPSVDLGASSYLEYPDTPTHDKPSTAVTAYVRLQRTGTPDTWGGLFCNVYDPAGTPWNTWAIQQNENNTGSLRGQLAFNGTQAPFESTTNIISTTEHVSAFLRWRTEEFASLTVLNERGNIIAHYNSEQMLWGTLDYATGYGIRINADEIATENYSALYSQAMLWSRKLSDVELQALVADPFGWYSPRRETVTLAGPFPIVYATTFRVYGYAMFTNSTERNALQAELQTWLDAHTGADAWSSGYVMYTQSGATEYTLPGGFATPNLMDEAETPTGPHPGLTWSFEVATKELRDSFGAVPGLGSAWANALEGSRFGEATI